MARPSKKSYTMEQFLEKHFGRTSAIEKGVCVWCGKSVGKFRNELSKKEYAISGFCQECQDKTFGVEE